jgi:hypothetical protein
MKIERFWVEPDDRDGWIVRREDPMEVYRFEDKASAAVFAETLARRYRPSTVAVRSKDGVVEKEWIYPKLSENSQ